MSGSSRPARKKVWLVQRSIWDMETESMPLASGYFKAMVDADPVLSRELDTRIINFGGGQSTLEMAKRIFLDEAGVPDVLAFSVFGWNYNAFGKLAETFKQLRPDGWVIFGGTHVAKQGRRTFAMFPAVEPASCESPSRSWTRCKSLQRRRCTCRRFRAGTLGLRRTGHASLGGNWRKLEGITTQDLARFSSRRWRWR